MAPKPSFINGRAPGYWGRDIRCRIGSEFLTDKVLVQNYDKIVAMGLPYALWREASTIIPDAVQCSCFKDTAKQPDIPCAQCYGTGAIPGYLKFGTQNYWVEATADVSTGYGTGGYGQGGFGEIGNWTLTDVVLDKTNRPFRLMLHPTAVAGTAISPTITINPADLALKVGPWETKVDCFTRDGGANSTIVTEASKDGGLTWFSLTAMETQAPTTQLKFKVTFTRTAVTVKTPMFEIVRARFATMGDLVSVLNEPVIRAIPTWDQETEVRQNFGTKMENTNKRVWTLPLTFFNITLAKETPAARIADDCIFEVRYGGEIGFRFAAADFSYSDTFGVFTRQEFGLRRVAGSPGSLVGEVYYRVF